MEVEREVLIIHTSIFLTWAVELMILFAEHKDYRNNRFEEKFIV